MDTNLASLSSHISFLTGFTGGLNVNQYGDAILPFYGNPKNNDSYETSEEQVKDESSPLGNF